MALAAAFKPDPVEPNFDAAQTFLDQARAAKIRGDEQTCKAACKLVRIALGEDSATSLGRL